MSNHFKVITMSKLRILVLRNPCYTYFNQIEHWDANIEVLFYDQIIKENNEKLDWSESQLVNYLDNKGKEYDAVVFEDAKRNYAPVVQGTEYNGQLITISFDQPDKIRCIDHIRLDNSKPNQVKNALREILIHNSI
ncbi:MAG: hypothetical protein MAG795_00574 [Candidatus Woesearchaeota archaeon]|nr:hypothetical protein [Candidatus Woesearchaeota archaeon]